MKREWTKHDQALWDCIKIALDGLKRLDWLTIQEYDSIVAILQNAIELKDTP